MTHIKPIFYGIHEDSNLGWRSFIKIWWGICKKQDSLSIDTFDEEWAMLINILDQFKSKVNHEKFNNANKWLQTLYNRKSQWAARWMWGHLTMGAY